MPTMSADTSGSSVKSRMPSKRPVPACALQRRVDLVLRRVALLRLHAEVDERDVGHRDAHRDAVQLAASAGITSPIAFAAPVDVGIIDTAAARARRRSLCGSVEDHLVVRVGVRSSS